MSETVARQRPSIDLDDFERRLRRSTSTHEHEDDPLAELARLVGEQQDPYGDVFAHEAMAGDAQGRREPGFPGEERPRRPLGDFAAIEAGLRGAIPAHAEMPATDQAFHVEHDQSHGHEPAYQNEEDGWFDPAQVAPQQRPPQRSRKPLFAVAATIAVGVIGIGVAFAYKGSSSSPREIKTIMAAAGPTKIQPPADGAADQADQDAGVLGKSQTTPTKLVSREEQPVDLTQAVQDNAARDAAKGTDASSVPVPPPPGQGEGAAGFGAVSPDYSAMGAAQSAPAPTSAPTTSYGDQGFGVGMPAPKKVKVVSVRPDGTVLPGDEQQDGAAQAAPAPKATAAPPKPASPKASGRTPKTTSRVATTAKPIDITTASADDAAGDTPAPKPAKTHKTKPQRVASADTGAQETTDATAPAAVTGGSGGFAVQLAAPGSEAEAKNASTRLGKKFSSALAGHHLGFHKADSNGHSVYRVRVSSLSKDDAVSLCEKVKANGGSCFVAKN